MMKILLILLLSMACLPAFAVERRPLKMHPHCQPDPSKPHHCHKSESPKPGPSHPAGGYAVVGAVASLAVSSYMDEKGYNLKSQLGWSVIAPAVVASLMEKESRHRDDAVMSAVLGGLTAQYLRHEF